MKARENEDLAFLDESDSTSPLEWKYSVSKEAFIVSGTHGKMDCDWGKWRRQGVGCVGGGGNGCGESPTPRR